MESTGPLRRTGPTTPSISNRGVQPGDRSGSPGSVRAESSSPYSVLAGAAHGAVCEGVEREAWVKQNLRWALPRALTSLAAGPPLAPPRTSRVLRRRTQMRFGVHDVGRARQGEPVHLARTRPKLERHDTTSTGDAVASSRRVSLAAIQPPNSPRSQPPHWSRSSKGAASRPAAS